MFAKRFGVHRDRNGFAALADRVRLTAVDKETRT